MTKKKHHGETRNGKVIKEITKRRRLPNTDTFSKEKN